MGTLKTIFFLRPPKRFGNIRNKDFLGNFVNNVLPGNDIQDEEFIPTNLELESRAKKLSILDVVCPNKNGSK